jgi:hypothetical protein
MKFNYAKKKYSIFVILTSLITGFIFLITIKANNRKARSNILSSIYSIYNETLTNITNNNNKLGYKQPYHSKSNS